MSDSIYYLYMTFESGELVLSKTKPESRTFSFIDFQPFDVEWVRLGIVHIHYAMPDGTTITQILPYWLNGIDNYHEYMDYMIYALKQIPCDDLSHRLYNINGEEVDVICMLDMAPANIVESDLSVSI